MKGQYGEECNITSCQKPNSAFWFNHSTRQYYCGECANRLNNDVFNKRDAQEMFGHELCTLEQERGVVFKEKQPLEQLVDNIIRDAENKLLYDTDFKSGREKRRERRKKLR